MSRTYRTYWDKTLHDHSNVVERYRHSSLPIYRKMVERLERVYAQKQMARIRKKRPTKHRYPDGKPELMKDPGWWQKLIMERPFRAKNKRISKKILNGYYDPEEALYPKNHKKPYIWWW